MIRSRSARGSATTSAARAERSRANKAKAISFAAYYALVDLFPNLRGLADAQLAELGYAPTDDSIPARVGTACARP